MEISHQSIRMLCQYAPARQNRGAHAHDPLRRQKSPAPRGSRASFRIDQHNVGLRSVQVPPVGTVVTVFVPVPEVAVGVFRVQVEVMGVRVHVERELRPGADPTEKPSVGIREFLDSARSGLTLVTRLVSKVV